MQTYLIERHFGHVTPEQLAEGGSRSKRCANEQFADSIVWRQTHAAETAEGLVTYCLYKAADESSIVAHAEAAGLPCDKITPVQIVGPDDFD